MELTRREFLKLGAWTAAIAAASLAYDKAVNEPAREEAEREKGEDPPP